MKTLTRFELAIVKRTAQNTKSLRTKRDKLVEKIAKAQQEMDEINQMIDRFEAPVVEMTGGFNSEQVLASLAEKENEVEVNETDCTETPSEVEEVSQDMPWGEN